MSDEKYLSKINFLETLDIEFYIKKKKPNAKEIVYNRQVIVIKELKEKHEGVLEKFIFAAKNFHPALQVNYLSNNDILNKFIKPSSTDNNFVNLILCDKNTKNIFSEYLVLQDDIFKSNFNKNIFLFNTLLVSDKITNELKKKLWKDFKYTISL